MASVAVERVRRLIDGLRRDRRTDPYHGRREYSQLARELVAACEALIENEPASVPALAQRAVDLVPTALIYVDDSSGIVGDDLHALMVVQAGACAATPPNPKRLAAWLEQLRLDGPGWPDFELRDYATALGEKGRAELALTCLGLAISAASEDLVSAALAELGAAGLSGTYPIARGWSISSWLVARASGFAADRVTFDGRAWTMGSGTWSQTGLAGGVLSLHHARSAA